jgi:chorismate mutase-like protein
MPTEPTDIETGLDAPRRRIEALRRRIDAIDAQIVALLNERASCAVDIGHLKEQAGLPIYQPAREAEVLARVREANGGPLKDDAITRLFERIIDEARRLERLAAAERRPGPDLER